MNPIIVNTLANARENYGFNRHSKDHHRRLKYVLAQEGPERWRAAANFWLYLNPVSKVVDDNGRLIKTEDARMQNRHIIAAVAEMRKDNHNSGNKFATSDDPNSGRRHMFSMPAGMLKFIEMIDPDVLQGDPQQRRDSVRKLARTFPEYCVTPEV